LAGCADFSKFGEIGLYGMHTLFLQHPTGTHNGRCLQGT
jgi:hypothetical protein